MASSLEAELDAALEELDHPPSTVIEDQAREALAIDFAEGQEDNDGFATERARERDRVQPVTMPVLMAPEYTQHKGDRLAERLLSTQFGKLNSGNGFQGSRIKSISLSVLIVFILAFVVTPHAPISFQTGNGARGCAAFSNPLDAMTEMSASFHVPGHVWLDKEHREDLTPNVAVLFRGYALGPTVAAQILASAEQLRLRRADVWLSLDNSFAHNGTHAMVAAIRNSKERLILGRDIKMHQYTDESIRELFPWTDPAHSMSSHLQSGPKYALTENGGPEVLVTHDAKPHSPTLENLLMWVMHPEVVARQYRHVWVVDASVGIVGSLPTLLEQYSELVSDLLHVGKCEVEPVPKITSLRTLFHKYSGELWKKVSHRWKDGTAQRYSARLLEELKACSLRGIAEEETLAGCTLCEKAGFICDCACATQYL